MPRNYAVIPSGDPLAPVTPSPIRAVQDREIVTSRLTARGVSLDADEWKIGVCQVPRDYARFPFVVVDLFAGAGGSSTGIIRALESMRVPVLLIQVNHWDTAIQTQILNFPDAIHLNASVETPDPVAIVPWLHIDFLCGSPECITFSPARGRKKIREQSRSSAAFLLTWLERVNVVRFAFENVKEWKTQWGRLNKEGTATRKGYEGEYYRAFFRRLKALGYKRAIDGVINAADQGSPTCRHRLYIIGEKSNRPLRMPEPTHTRYPERYPNRKPWRTAREIIDFRDKGQSSFARFARDGSPEGPHAVASLQRTRAGYERQIPERRGAAAYARAFELLIPIARDFHESNPPTLKSLQNAKVTVADAWRIRYGLERRNKKLTPRECERILLASASEWRKRYSVTTTAGPLSDQDRRTIKETNVLRSREATRLAFGEPIMHFEDRIEPDGFTVADRTHSVARSLEQPVHAMTSATGCGLFVAQPTIMGQHGGSAARSVDDSPVMTIAKAGAITLSQPMLTRANASATSTYDDTTRDCERPLGTLVAKTCLGLVQPVLSGVSHGAQDAREHEIDAPIAAITQKRVVALNQPEAALAGPALIEVAHGDHPKGQRRAADMDSPLGALHAGGGKYALADPQISTLYSGYDRGAEAAHRSVNEPTPPITAGGGHIAVIQPSIEAETFILSRNSAHEGRATDGRSHRVSVPTPTLTASGGGYVVQPTIIPQHSTARLRNTDEPIPTVVGIARIGLQQGAGPEPFIYEPHGERDTQAERVHSIDKPALTVTPRGAGTLVQAQEPATDPVIRHTEYKPKITINGVVYVIDSYFRMLRNIELARAMDLVDERRGYSFEFAGSETEITRQIGNAVASNVMEALTRVLCEHVVGVSDENTMIEVMLAPFPIDGTFGIYNERVVRRESRATAASPAWFTPRENPLHVGIHEPGDRHTFIELAGNDVARSSQHPYEVEIVEQSDQATALELFPLAA